jgi:tetrapyrrole methylase family protein/MazG family protein
MAATITIAGLGAGSPGQITREVLETLKASKRNYFRTGRHPAAEWLRQNGVDYVTFDHYYDSAADFKEVYLRIAETLLSESLNAPLVYAVPGHPLVSEESVRQILDRACQAGVEVIILPGTSFLDALFVALKLDPGPGLTLVDALRLDELKPSPQSGAIVTQLYSRLVASDVKLSLLEIYRPEHRVTLVRAAGVPGEERIQDVCLYEIDRLSWVDHLTSLYIPPDGRRTAGACGPDTAPGEMEVIQIYEEEDACAENGDPLDGHLSACDYPLDPLVQIMARLRAPGGCPWDREQNHQTLKRYLLEETYEVLETLDEEDMYKLCEELGDLLLQIVFHAQIASENRHFGMNDVISGISEKLVRRHPHVFGTAIARDSGEVKVKWEEIKAREKKQEGSRTSILEGLPRSLPALIRAFRLQEKAALVGFDWPDCRGAFEKTREELLELETAIASSDQEMVEGEAGDLLFSAVNLARLLGVDPEAALSGTNAKFTRRFAYIEETARTAGKELLQCTLEELDAWWEEAKIEEKGEKNKETIS